MTLLDVRKEFIKHSGRFDLVVDLTTHADNGADFFIQAGQRWLDRKAKFLDQDGKMYRTLEAGDYRINLQTARVVKSVAAGTADSKKFLTYLDPIRLRKRFPKPFGAMTQGMPIYWTLANLKEVEPITPVGGMDEYRETEDEHLTYDTMLILPVPDQPVHVTIWGEFYLGKLSQDEDTNFWTENEPGILAKAGLRELEAFYRNYSGVNDWTNSILQDLIEIEFDYVENAYHHYDQMEG